MTSKYHPDDITQIDVMGYLRKNESCFFRSGAYDAVELAGMIATEAVTLGAEKVHIQSDGEWLTVSADRDWLVTRECEAFHAVTPFPEAGVNSMLAEVLAFAFSAGVTTATCNGVKVIKGGVASPAGPVGQGTARLVSFSRRREILEP
ncbi:hypothetical protein ACWEKM_46200 [Streptomyces sp. NPDC004752]